MYKLNGLPIGWAWAPPIVVGWLKKIELKGEKVGSEILFTFEEVKSALQKQKVPHIADFIGNEDLRYSEANCIKI